MSANDVSAFFTRLSTDDAFAEQLAAAKADPAAVQQLIADAGFEVTPEEVRDAFLEHYGDQLTEEQLAVVAGGLSRDAENGIMVGSVATGIVVVSVAGAAAAAA